MHEGRGELCTVTQADTVHAHPGLRERRAALERAAQACDAVLRLLDSTEANRARLQPALQRARAARRGPGRGHPRARARVPGQAAAGGRLRARAGLVRRLRRDRAPRRLLAERGRRGLRGCEAGSFPLGERRTRFLAGALAGRWPRPPARPTGARARPTARSRRRSRAPRPRDAAPCRLSLRPAGRRDGGASRALPSRIQEEGHVADAAVHRLALERDALLLELRARGLDVVHVQRDRVGVRLELRARTRRTA